MGSRHWAEATAGAFDMLRLEECAEVVKPEWWNDEGLKALSARVVRAAPDDGLAHQMRATVLTGQCPAWLAGPRSAAELMEAATHYERAAAALHPVPPPAAIKPCSPAARAGAAARRRGHVGPTYLMPYVQR